jgi:hypothetical protein
MQETQGDKRFVSVVRPTTTVAYISIEELTKSRVSLNHNTPKLPPRPTRFLLSIPTKRRATQTSQDFTIILGSSRVIPSYLGDRIPKSNKCNKVVRERMRCPCLKVAHSRKLESSLKNKKQY